MSDLQTLPEKGLGRNGADEPLKKLACSFPAIVDPQQLRQHSI